jgi:tRNA-splicing ligase RtcB
MNPAFGSSCHGAGRRLSRAAARAQVDVNEVMERLRASGVHLKHGTERGLAEEAPEAYKPVDDVVDATEDAGLARRVAKLSPRVVVKG